MCIRDRLKETLAPTSMNPQARQITKRTIPETKQNQAKPHGRRPSYKTNEISKDVLSVSTYYESTTVIARTLREIKIACAISSLLAVCSQIHPRFVRKASQKPSQNRRISSKWHPRTTQKPLVSLTRNMMHTRGGSTERRPPTFSCFRCRCGATGRICPPH